MNYKYEYIFFKYLYEILNLKECDNKLETSGIEPYDKENMGNRISKYFALKNEGNNNEFSPEDKEKFNLYFSKELDELLNEPLYSEVRNFVARTFETYFFSNISEKYMYYGPSSYEYMAPTDAIVLGINYVKFDIENENYDETINNQEDVIIEVATFIQEELAEKSNLKLAAIPYNEIALNQPFIRL